MENINKEKITCSTRRLWVGWEGTVMVDKNVYRTGIIRETKSEALQDAKKVREELEKRIEQLEK